jgi:hypothetical protein
LWVFCQIRASYTIEQFALPLIQIENLVQIVEVAGAAVIPLLSWVTQSYHIEIEQSTIWMTSIQKIPRSEQGVSITKA